jgi:hypothetical protein
MMTERRVPAHILVLAAVIVFSLVSTATAGREWFPEKGSSAIHQRCLDVENPAVAMVIALQPGYEDLALLAYLRTQLGARTSVVYLTNGEGTPGDTLARFPLLVTGERKLEAERVARQLDADSWFVNLPDVPAAGSGPALRTIWDSAAARRKLVVTIRTFKPDIVVVGADRRLPDAATLRDTVALQLVNEAVAEAATLADTSRSKNLYPWKVNRVFVQTRSHSVPRAFLGKHPSLKASPIEIARSVAPLYRTMRLRVPEWIDAGGEYRNASLGEGIHGAVSPELLMNGLSAMSKRLVDINAAIRAAVKRDKRGMKSATLGPLSHAIDVAEYALATRPKDLPPLEQRLLVALKNGLEDLRCAVLGVSVSAVQSESLLTESQIWFLTLSVVQPRTARGTTEVIFPLATNKEWVVNETLEYQFSLDSSTQFTVLTPENMPFAIPAAEYGLRQNALSVKFPFVVVHRDPKRERNFMYRSSISLGFGPRRSFVVKTPVISDDTLSPVIYELRNFSRNTFKGKITLSDTLGHSSERPVDVVRKDQVILDTLYVPCSANNDDRYRLFTLELSGRGGKRSVTARQVVSAIDSTKRVGMLSSLDASPVGEALRALHQPHEVLSAKHFTSGLARVSTIIIDRDMLSDPSCTAQMKLTIADWVWHGGHAIVFPQLGVGSTWLTSICGTGFEPIEPLPPASEVAIDTVGLMSPLNGYAASDWQGWVESRAFVAIRRSSAGGYRPAIASGSIELMATVTVGQGRITLVAADLISQLVNFHPGAFRILATMLGS